MAAKELFVTPQAVSKAVGDLERELHVDLCEKTGRSVKPTAFGRMFSVRASEALSCLFDLETLAKTQTAALVQDGTLSLDIACSSCRGNAFNSHDLDSFNDLYPRITLDVTYHASGSSLAAVEEGLVDAAIIVGRTNKPTITCIKIRSFPLHVALAKKHPLASKPSLRLDDLRDVRLAAPEDLHYSTRVITSHLAAQGIEPQFTSLAPFAEQHREFLEKEGGAMFVAADPYLETLYPASVVRPIEPEDLMALPLCLAYATNNTNAALPLLEQYLVGMATRIRRKHQ